MKSTGMIRRIDELGRIVIPKEIRRNLKIKEGESLEIFIDSEQIILKRFSNMNNIDDILKVFLKTLSEVFEISVLVTDRQKIISCTSNKEKKYLFKQISENLEELFENRKNIINNEKEEIEIVKNIVEKTNYYIIPLIINSEVDGLLIILCNNEINDDIKVSADIISKIIINYIE